MGCWIISSDFMKKELIIRSEKIKTNCIRIKFLDCVFLCVSTDCFVWSKIKEKSQLYKVIACIWIIYIFDKIIFLKYSICGQVDQVVLCKLHIFFFSNFRKFQHADHYSLMPSCILRIKLLVVYSYYRSYINKIIYFELDPLPQIIYYR